MADAAIWGVCWRLRLLLGYLLLWTIHTHSHTHMCVPYIHPDDCQAVLKLIKYNFMAVVMK